MKKLDYDIKQRKRASTLIALASTEIEAINALIEKELFREAVIHLYFASFYLSHALLLKDLTKTNPSHDAVDCALHKVYGRKIFLPKRYIKMHSRLHNLRTDVSYRSAHTPETGEIIKYAKQLGFYSRFVSSCIVEIDFPDILRDILEDNPDKIKDFSIDIYCPKTYSHHVRFTLWFPPFYLNIFNLKNLFKQMRQVLQRNHVKNHGNYVAGLNSRLNQYEEMQLLMIDIDSISVDVESRLSKIGGILLKSGRGYHFIGRKILSSRTEWTKALRGIMRDRSLRHRADKKHIKISLQRGYSTLRVTSSPAKPARPMFFKEF